MKLAERKFLMVLLAIYAALALGVAAVGIFGVVSYQVAQRTSEFGVRLALGANPAGVLGLVLSQIGRLVLIGLVAGLAVSMGTNRLLANQLFGLSPHDPILLGSISGLLLLVALAASFVPSFRAAKTNPSEALRHE